MFSSGPQASFSHDDARMSKYFGLGIFMEHRTQYVVKIDSKICIPSTLLTQGIDMKLAVNAWKRGQNYGFTGVTSISK